jgi:hypothetical protein
MRRHELPMKSADEHDALTRWRRFLHWRPGVRRQIKKGYNKRVRRAVKQELQQPEEVDILESYALLVKFTDTSSA